MMASCTMVRPCSTIWRAGYKCLRVCGFMHAFPKCKDEGTNDGRQLSVGMLMLWAEL